MLEFVNDPQFDGLPLVGEGHVLVAVRTQCGRAARWVPGGDVVALAEFLGPAYPVVGDRLFEQRADGSLFPVDLSSPFWVLVPPAGEPVMYGKQNLTPSFAQVVAVGSPAPKVAPAPEVASLTPEVDSDPAPAAPVKAAVKKAAAAKKEKAADE